MTTTDELSVISQIRGEVKSDSPALMADVLRGYGMTVYECDLNQVLRQSEASGILWNATRIREIFSSNLLPHSSFLRPVGSKRPSAERLLPRIKFSGFSDISVVPGDELIESLSSSYSRVGMDETMVITRSNKRANIYNQGIRNTVLDREDELCRGDLLMIVKNNYFWEMRN